ncbi:MAG: hypothetical protein GIX03_07910 [Candidatus Eremiobacteraeota bacterium]|nr:hypothetical protein [Candidatus Eremiobacteraeota bacterium]MBC5802912.1 hypothetical protein [Candidatus Eremiobacteraeota bacterium]MBC5821134.1 hypothetical protein [Candidatus Eremiobacteraeota bacterium]
MNATGAVNVPRLTAIATLLLCVLGASLVYFAFNPQVEALQSRLDDEQATLRSEEVAFAEIPHVRLERDQLARRYDRLLAENPEAVFLSDLDATMHRHNVRLSATTIIHDATPTTQTPEPQGQPSLFTPTRVRLELRGTYAHLLAAIGDVSLGAEIVRVEAPSLQRSGNELTASVPVTIFEPAASR